MPRALMRETSLFSYASEWKLHNRHITVINLNILRGGCVLDKHRHGNLEHVGMINLRKAVGTHSKRFYVNIRDNKPTTKCSLFTCKASHRKDHEIKL